MADLKRPSTVRDLLSDAASGRTTFGSSSSADYMRASPPKLDSVLDRAAAALDAAKIATGGVSLFGTRSAADELGRIASGKVGDIHQGSTPALDAARAAIDRATGRISKSTIEAAMGGIGGSLGKTLTDLKSVRGFDTATINDITGGFDRLGSASSTLEDVLRGRNRDPLAESFNHNPPRLELPPIPPNPIHRTNDLLDTLVTELSEQREVIDASAAAQQRQIELLAQLVAAFVASQVDAPKSIRRANWQVWTGVAGLVVAVLTLALTR